MFSKRLLTNYLVMTHFMFDKMMGEWQTAVTYNVFFFKIKNVVRFCVAFRVALSWVNASTGQTTFLN